MIFGAFLFPFKHRVKLFKKYSKNQQKVGSITLYSTLMNWIRKKNQYNRNSLNM